MRRSSEEVTRDEAVLFALSCIDAAIDISEGARWEGVTVSRDELKQALTWLYEFAYSEGAQAMGEFRFKASAATPMPDIGYWAPSMRRLRGNNANG